MRRGRKPSPARLHIVRGTARADRAHGDAAPEAETRGQPIGLLPDPPEHLGEHARAFWLALRAELESLGLGTSADQWDVEAAALLYQRARHAEERIPAGGFFTCKKTGDPKRHPAAVEALQARKELRLILEAIGVSTPGRVRVLGSAKREPQNPEEQFFDRARA